MYWTEKEEEWRVATKEEDTGKIILSKPKQILSNPTRLPAYHYVCTSIVYTTVYISLSWTTESPAKHSSDYYSRTPLVTTESSTNACTGDWHTCSSVDVTPTLSTMSYYNSVTENAQAFCIDARFSSFGN